MKKFGLFTVLAVLLLFFAVSCAQSVDEEDKVVQVGFSAQYGDDDSSRSLKIDVDTDYKVEDLFWTYKAVKKSGIHTKGQQKTHVSLSAGDTRGLAGYVKEFSTGKWDLEIKGYLDKAHTASKLIYTGTLTNYEISATDTNTVLPFVLNAYPDYGTLKFGTMTIKVPSKRNFNTKFTLTATIYDITSGTSVKIATSTTNSTAAKTEGTSITLSAFTFESGKEKFVSGTTEAVKTHRLQVVIKYKDTATTGTVEEEMFSGTFDVSFRKGCTTTISGDFNDYVKTFYPLQTLGGTVFYIRPTTAPTASANSSIVYGNQYGEVWTNNTLYIFYKADGTPVNLSGKTFQTKRSTLYNEKAASYNLYGEMPVGGVSSGSTSTLLQTLNTQGATYYTIAQKPSSGYKDCVFVYDKYTGGGMAWGSSTVTVPVEDIYDIGKGKSNTATIKAISGIRQGDSAFGYNTLFDYLAWMNGETCNNSSVWSAKRLRVPGCADWYVPSILELQALFTSGFDYTYMTTKQGTYHCIWASSVRSTSAAKGADVWTYDTGKPDSTPANIRTGVIGRGSNSGYNNGCVLVRSF